jgi:hypothetical protein
LIAVGSLSLSVNTPNTEGVQGFRVSGFQVSGFSVLGLGGVRVGMCPLGVRVEGSAWNLVLEGLLVCACLVCPASYCVTPIKQMCVRLFVLR